MRERILSGAALTVAIAIAACQSAPAQTEAPRATAPASPTTVASSPAASGDAARAATEAVAAFDGSAASVGRLHAVLDHGGAVAPALAPLLTSDDLGRRFAATYLLALVARSPAEAEPLRAVLADPNAELRAVAAGGLAAAGLGDGLRALVDLVEAEGDMPFSDPPLRITEYADATLSLLTGADASDPAGWRAWWSANGSRLQWDGHRYVATP